MIAHGMDVSKSCRRDLGIEGKQGTIWKQGSTIGSQEPESEASIPPPSPRRECEGIPCVCWLVCWLIGFYEFTYIALG